MTPDKKIAIYFPKNRGPENIASERSDPIKDNFDTVMRNQIIQNESTDILLQGIKVYNPISPSGRFYYSGFGRGLIGSNGGSQPSRTMVYNAQALVQMWDCMFETTGLGFFFGNQRRIYTEALYDSLETLLSTSEIKDCSRLMLNIPATEANDLDADDISADFRQSHPMHEFLGNLADRDLTEGVK